jgi:hypothetical protein
LITSDKSWICLKFLIKLSRIKSLYLRIVVRRSIINLNENGQIKIVQKVFGVQPKTLFFRFDTNRLMP